MNGFDFIKNRGFIFQISNEKTVKELLEKPSTKSFYIGFDPTADSLHLGSMYALMVARHLAGYGLRPIIVLGGATAMIGDPSGKTEMRKLLTRDQIKHNLSCISKQIKKVLPKESDPLFMDNSDWLGSLSMIDYLRDVGRHFSVNRMLTQDCVKQRMESGLSYLEFSYMLLQSYDFAYLAKNYNCALQIGGADQWGNMVMGMELTRRIHSIDVDCFTFSLMTTASGEKMGKTANGAVWLDPEKTKPYEYYQYWKNVDDRDVERFLRFYTVLEEKEINSLAGNKSGQDLNIAKEILAYEATTILHGKEEADRARESSKALFSGDVSNLEGVPSFKIDKSRLINGITIVDLIAESGMAPSKSEARRLVDGGGVYINGERVGSATFNITEKDIKNDVILLRTGKKKFIKILF